MKQSHAISQIIIWLFSIGLQEMAKMRKQLLPEVLLQSGFSCHARPTTVIIDIHDKLIKSFIRNEQFEYAMVLVQKCNLN